MSPLILFFFLIANENREVRLKIFIVIRNNVENDAMLYSCFYFFYDEMFFIIQSLSSETYT